MPNMDANCKTSDNNEMNAIISLMVEELNRLSFLVNRVEEIKDRLRTEPQPCEAPSISEVAEPYGIMDKFYRVLEMMRKQNMRLEDTTITIEKIL